MPFLSIQSRSRSCNSLPTTSTTQCHRQDVARQKDIYSVVALHDINFRSPTCIQVRHGRSSHRDPARLCGLGGCGILSFGSQDGHWHKYVSKHVSYELRVHSGERKSKLPGRRIIPATDNFGVWPAWRVGNDDLALRCAFFLKQVL